MEVHAIDYHTAGEPLRIVTAGLPEIHGETMLDRRRYFREHLDHYRKFLMLEPRGHADMYGAVLTPAASPDGDIGVLFLHNAGYSTMCGHGIIALVTAGLEHRLFEIADEHAIRIDTPAGRILARADVGAGGRVETVSFLNVPSFVLKTALEVEVGDRCVTCTIAYGGAFYAYVDAANFGFELVPAEASEVIRTGQAIKDAVSDRYDVRHPDGDDALNFLYGTIFVLPTDHPHRSRNACVFAEGELDRSPTGTGVSGRAAIHYARGEITLGDELEIESIIGSSFKVRCTQQVQVGGLEAVVPEVTGSAWMSGEHRFVLDPGDPLGPGFLVR